MMPVDILPPGACPVPPDLGAVSSRVGRMSDDCVSSDREARISEACTRQRSQHPGDLSAKLEGSRLKRTHKT